MLSYLTYHVSLGSCLSDKELCQSSPTSPLGVVLLVCFTRSMLFYVCQTTVADQKLMFAYCTVRLELIFSNTVYPFKVPFPLFSLFCFSFSFLSFWRGEQFLLVFLVNFLPEAGRDRFRQKQSQSLWRMCPSNHTNLLPLVGTHDSRFQIGRASCRERVSSPV